MPKLHTEEQEQTSMDARTAVRILIFAAAAMFILYACTDNTSAGSDRDGVTTSTELQFTGYDMHYNAGSALRNLEIFLQSTSTTTAAVQHHINVETIDVWDELAQCETNGDWSANTGNGFGGGVQFAHQPAWSTWNAYGGTEFTEHPWEATREQQIEIAQRVLQSAGWGAWPGCARKIGLLQ